MTKRRTRTSAAITPAVLNEDVFFSILRAAKAAGVLTALASSSRQLCTLARSSVPVKLCIISPEQAALVIASHAHSRPPFSGCTQLRVKARDPASCVLASGVVYAAQQWTALVHLRLDLYLDPAAQQLQPGVLVECYTSNFLCCLPALQQLRRLELNTAEFGTCSAERVAQLPQLTQLTLGVRVAVEGAPPNLSALSRLTNLVQLKLEGACVTQPAAAGATGPAHLPSSLTWLVLHAPAPPCAAAIASWATHLGGCPQLRALHIKYGQQQHPSVHPSALVPLLARHNQQLRTLRISYIDDDPDQVDWSGSVTGLPDAVAPVSSEWRPDDALASLSGLQVLSEQQQLRMRHQSDWQHLAQLTALSSLTRASLYCAPAEQLVASLQVLEGCSVALGGHDLGRVLLACPLLKRVQVSLCEPPASVAVQPGGTCLQPHPFLQRVEVTDCCEWGSTATTQFGALAPVLAGVKQLMLLAWPHGGRAAGLPDLSLCTALTSLGFVCEIPEDSEQLPAEQEAYLSMLAPLAQLQVLVLSHAPRVTARLVVPLQHMLPQLRKVVLRHVGTLLPEDEELTEEQQQQEEAAALQQVKQLLRPGLELTVTNP
jgi:hypothetical protein